MQIKINEIHPDDETSIIQILNSCVLPLGKIETEINNNDNKY
jgi:hypothetical protein